MLPTITTPRLILRPYQPGDIDSMVRVLGSIEVARNTLTLPHPYTREHALSWLALMSVEDAPRISWAITLRQPPVGVGPFIGGVGFQLEPVHRHAELGYSLGVEFWGNGYATEAANEAIRHGFEVLGLHRINAGYYTRNPASGRVLEKLGFAREGLRPQMYTRFGEWVDLVLVGLLRSDWQAKRASGAAAR